MSADIKVIILGHKNVGKTSIFNRYIYDDFGKTSMTIGAYFHMKQCRIKERTYNLAIWDTAGEEKFDSLTNFYCRNAKAALVCYDITDYSTFEGLQRWVDKVQKEADEKCALVIVGNKLDLVETHNDLRRVDLKEAQRYAKSVNADLFELSAASGKNVQDAFTKLVLLSLQRNQGGFKAAEDKKLDLKAANNDQKKSCCS